MDCNAFRIEKRLSYFLTCDEFRTQGMRGVRHHLYRRHLDLQLESNRSLAAPEKSVRMFGSGLISCAVFKMSVFTERS